MSQMNWGVVQRLCDDEPPLRVWREERSLGMGDLAEQSGIEVERLTTLEPDMSRATDAEVNRLAAALRIPAEFLMMPHHVGAE